MLTLVVTAVLLTAGHHLAGVQAFPCDQYTAANRPMPGSHPDSYTQGREEKYCPRGQTFAPALCDCVNKPTTPPPVVNQQPQPQPQPGLGQQPQFSQPQQPDLSAQLQQNPQLYDMLVRMKQQAQTQPQPSYTSPPQSPMNYPQQTAQTQPFPGYVLQPSTQQWQQPQPQRQPQLQPQQQLSFRPTAYPQKVVSPYTGQTWGAQPQPNPYVGVQQPGVFPMQAAGGMTYGQQPQPRGVSNGVQQLMALQHYQQQMEALRYLQQVQLEAQMEKRRQQQKQSAKKPRGGGGGMDPIMMGLLMNGLA